MVRLSAFLIFLSFVASVSGQTPRTLSSVTVANGLSQGFVTSLFQDSRGFIWIGSLYGLNRYDGYEIKSYTPDLTAPHALRASSIYSICEAPGGVIWLGTEKGLVAFDPYSERFFSLSDTKSDIPGGSANQVFVRKNGSLVVRNGEKNIVFEVSPPENLMKIIRSDATDAGLFRCRLISYDNSINQPIRQIRLSADSTLLAFDADGKL
ncbi:MAG: two-component regulator propeller domain-containing protein, partial [Bacteroidota bacterium]